MNLSKTDRVLQLTNYAVEEEAFAISLITTLLLQLDESALNSTEKRYANDILEQIEASSDIQLNEEYMKHIISLIETGQN